MTEFSFFLETEVFFAEFVALLLIAVSNYTKKEKYSTK